MESNGFDDLDWEYDDTGTIRWRGSGLEQDIEVWDGTKWKEGTLEPPATSITAEGQSRAAQLSALGTDRKPTSEASGDGFTVYTVKNESLGLGVVEVIVLPTGRDVWLDEQTLDRLYDNPKHEELFLDKCETWSAGMKYLMEDVSFHSSFADAKAEDAKKKHEAKKDVIEVDVLDVLNKRAQALIVQAAEYNAEPSVLVSQSFALKLAEVQTELRELERRLEEVRDNVGLAETAVMEALT